MRLSPFGQDPKRSILRMEKQSRTTTYFTISEINGAQTLRLVQLDSLELLRSTKKFSHFSTAAKNWPEAVVLRIATP